MLLSKQDTFCEKMALGASAKNSENDLDLGRNGDDIQHGLFWSLFVDSVSNAVEENVTVAWVTSDTADFASTTTLLTKEFAAAAVVKGAYLVKNEPLPKGLKRYSRLAFEGVSATKFPYVTAFVHDGRDEGTPFTGL